MSRTSATVLPRELRLASGAVVNPTPRCGPPPPRPRRRPRLQHQRGQAPTRALVGAAAVRLTSTAALLASQSVPGAHRRTGDRTRSRSVVAGARRWARPPATRRGSGPCRRCVPIPCHGVRRHHGHQGAGAQQCALPTRLLSGGCARRYRRGRQPPRSAAVLGPMDVGRDERAFQHAADVDQGRCAGGCGARGRGSRGRPASEDTGSNSMSRAASGGADRSDTTIPCPRA